MTITFHQIEIYEYYDGLVRGIGRTKTHSYLMVLSRWKIAERYKEFVALELDSKSANKFESELDLSGPATSAKWSEFENAFNRIARNFRGRILKFSAEPKVGETISFHLVEDVESIALAGYDLEAVIRNA